MHKLLAIILVTLTLGLTACKKDHAEGVMGTLVSKSGCFTDSWLVSIDSPDYGTHPFLRPVMQISTGGYDCSNAVFIRVATPFAIPGNKIHFTVVENLGVYCLSFSDAPNHLEVKNLTVGN